MIGSTSEIWLALLCVHVSSVVCLKITSHIPKILENAPLLFFRSEESERYSHVKTL